MTTSICSNFKTDHLKRNTMKTIFLTAILFLSTMTAHSQDTSRVWVSIRDYSIVGAEPASKFDILSKENAVFSIQRAFPNAHTRSLQQVYEVTCVCDPALLAAKMNTTDGLGAAEVVFEPELLYVPNDYSVAFGTDYALDLINAQGAWEYTHGDPSVILGITDVNYDMTHEELTGKVAAGGSTGSASVYHGTAVAVTAAGNTNNGLGKSAIGYDCKLALFTAQYNDLLICRDNGAKVVNASWHDGSCTPSRYLQQLINELYEDGVVVVAAAGNGSVTCGSANGVAYPAAYEHVISVTSIGPDDNHERYPGDPSTTHQHNAFVDISAPGYDVPLTVASGWYLTGNGSSFAAPFVTGTVGLMFSVNPCLTVDQVEYILKTTSVNIDALNPAYAGRIGAGRLNAEAAVRMALAYRITAGNATCNTSTAVARLQKKETTSEAEPQLEIYPNPAREDVQLRYPFKKGQSVLFSDAMGRTATLVTIEEDKDLMNVTALPAGVFTVTISGDGQMLDQKRLVVLN